MIHDNQQQTTTATPTGTSAPASDQTTSRSMCPSSVHTLPETSDYTDDDRRFMDMAIQLSVEKIDNGGGPFGAVIVKDGEVEKDDKVRY